MTPEEIYSQFIKKNQRILHIGCGDQSLKNLAEPFEYTGFSLDPADSNYFDLQNNYTELPSGFDYVVVSDALEFVDNPLEVINHIKNLGKSTVVYEFKYDDEDCPTVSGWRQHWKTIGLENYLTRQFDYVNNIFLGYATIHICEMPNNLEDLETVTE